MAIKTFSLIVMSAGISCLFMAISPTKHICDIEKKHKLAWRLLAVLILVFLLGYLYYIYLLFTREVTMEDILFSIILCGGGIFVITSVRLSLNSLKNIKKIAESERHRALHDELTELPNRALLYERIELAMLQAEREKSPISILLMDLNRFKEINDTLGHFYGDYLLQMIAPRLRMSVRKSDTIARFGGDEFAIVLPGVELERATNIAEKISLSMEEPFLIEGNRLSIDVSIGIALYPEHGKESDTLLQHADVALYEAKKSSNTCYSIYNASDDNHSMERLMLTVELREAIKNEELILYYQPKYSLREGKVCGLEALVRWPRKGHKELTNPDVFLEIAEKTGLIRPLTDLIFKKVFNQLSLWNEKAKQLPVSINLSTKVLLDIDLPNYLRDLLSKKDIDPSWILLEITESSMMRDPELAFKVIQELVNIGFKISIDDFGTGYSSLAILKRLPGCELKIDKSFIGDMIEDVNDMAIVQTSIDLANNMELGIVAEGVDSKETLDKLVDMGCEMAQGYYLCKPMPPEEILEQIDALDKSGYQQSSNK